MNRCTMMRVTGHAKPHDSNQRVSGIPGAVQKSVDERCSIQVFSRYYSKDSLTACYSVRLLSRMFQVTLVLFRISTYGSSQSLLHKIFKPSKFSHDIKQLMPLP